MTVLCINVAVTFARLFYPAEARNRIAMEMADAHSTSTCIGLSASKGSNGNLGKADLNEIPFMHKEKLQERLQALLKTGIVYSSETMQLFL